MNEEYLQTVISPCLHKMDWLVEKELLPDKLT